jgi:hypothetical protein
LKFENIEKFGIFQKNYFKIKNYLKFDNNNNYFNKILITGFIFSLINIKIKKKKVKKKKIKKY